MLCILPLLIPFVGGDTTHESLDQQFFAWSVQEIALPQGNPQELRVPVVLEEIFDTELVLSQHSVRGDNFVAYEQGEDGVVRPIPAPPISTYRGFVAGLPNSIVSANLHDGQLHASIYLGDGNGTVVLQPLDELQEGAAVTSHILYKQTDILPDYGWLMAEPIVVDGSEIPAPVKNNLPGATNSTSHSSANHSHNTGSVNGANTLAPGLTTTSSVSAGTGGRAADKTVAIACDADYKFYQKNNNSTSKTIQDIEDVLNDVEAIYQRDVNICWRLATVVVRTSSANDPYTSNNASTLLTQCQTEWNSNQSHVARDVVQLFTGRSVSGSTIGIAYLGVVCKTGIHYSMVQSRYTSNWSRRVSLSAHELGHTWGADHCCGSCSGCNSCHIMCPCNGGCSGNDSKFGSSSISSINSYKNNSAHCVVDGCGTGPTMTLSSPSPGNAGQYNKVTIKNGTPNSSVTIWYGGSAGSTSVNGCSGLTLGINRAKNAGVINLDSNGYGEMQKFVQGSAAGRTFLLQGSDSSACLISNLVTHTF